VTEARFGALDGLRCFSVVAVLWHHAGRDAAPWLPAAGRGFLGVDMFFVISGFLIVTLLLRERAEHGAISLRNFYARRTLRIFPVYYALLGVLLVYAWTAKNSFQGQAFLAEFPWHATYTSNFIVAASIMGITWSLSTEEQFYIVWPPVEKFLGVLVLPLLGAFVLLNQAVNFRLLDDWLLRAYGIARDELVILHTTFTPICLGVALAHALHDPRGRALAVRLLGARGAPLVCVAVLALLVNLPAADISGWQRLSIQLAMTALVCSCVVREDHLLQRFLAWPPIRRIGAVSYGMYLFHVLALYAVGKLLVQLGADRPLLRFALCLALTYAIAEISFRLLERPLLGLKRHFR
jgi:peptidoglycan/LPS O-acetylase OafA/YrhL